MHHMDANKTYEEKVWQQLHKNAASRIERNLESTANNKATVRPPTTHLKNYQSQTTYETLLEK